MPIVAEKNLEMCDVSEHADYFSMEATLSESVAAPADLTAFPRYLIFIWIMLHFNSLNFPLACLSPHDNNDIWIKDKYFPTKTLHESPHDSSKIG